MIGKRVAPGRADLSIWIFDGGALALGGGLAFKSHKPKCLRIFLTGDSIAQDVVVSAHLKVCGISNVSVRIRDHQNL